MKYSSKIFYVIILSGIIFQVLAACTSKNLDSDSLSFSEAQEYEGEILFENSENVRIKFYLSEGGTFINQIDFSMDKLFLEPAEQDSGVSNTVISDASLTNTKGFDVTDGKIISDSFFIFELTVIDSCIYGMISIEHEQNNILMANSPVYIVIPNITTPKDIPVDILFN